MIQHIGMELLGALRKNFGYRDIVDLPCESFLSSVQLLSHEQSEKSQ